MNVLITGGAGFVGSHVAKRLAKAGHDVAVYDNLSGRGIAGKHGAFPGALSSCTFIDGDVRDTANLERAMKGVDVVIHLAAIVSVPFTIAHPDETEAVNAAGSENVVRVAQRLKLKKVILASSAAVYGLGPKTPTAESEPLAPSSPYASTKVAMERAAEKARKESIATITLRFFNVYGPGQDPASQYAAVIPAFITRALKNEPLTIHGDGLQTRDFVFVEDVAAACELALTRGEGVYNIASGSSVTINDLAKLIVRLAHSSSAVKHDAGREGDPRESLADIAKAKQDLGFHPTVSLEQGLRETIEFFKRQK